MVTHLGDIDGLGQGRTSGRQTLASIEQAIQDLRAREAVLQRELEKEGILLMGCPVNNLVTEMSGVDEGFRSRLAEILDEWKATIAEGLRRGQAQGLGPAQVADVVATAGGLDLGIAPVACRPEPDSQSR